MALFWQHECDWKEHNEKVQKYYQGYKITYVSDCVCVSLVFQVLINLIIHGQNPKIYVHNNQIDTKNDIPIPHGHVSNHLTIVVSMVHAKLLKYGNEKY